jgi:HEAT repeat protein
MKKLLIVWLGLLLVGCGRNSTSVVVPQTPRELAENIRGSQDVPAIIQALKHEDRGVRRAVAERLGQLEPGAETVAALGSALEDQSEEVRTAAAGSLGRMGPKASAAADALARASLWDASGSVRKEAMLAVKQTGTPAPAVLVKGLADPNREVVERAVQFLGEASPEAVPALKDAVPALVTAWLKEEDGKFGHEIALALGAFSPAHDENTRSALEAWRRNMRDIREQAVRDRERDRRQGVAQVRPWPDSPLPPLGLEARPVLLASLSHEKAHVRRRAVDALGQPGPAAETDLPSLTKVLLKDPSPGVRRVAALALARLGQPACVPDLIKALKDTDASVRREGANALGRFGAKARAALPHLEEMLADEEASVSPRAAVALWRVDKEQATTAVHHLSKMLNQALKQLSGKELDRVGKGVVEALGEIGPFAKAAIPALAEALKAPSNELRKGAVAVLARMGEEAMPALNEALTSTDQEVRRAALEALKKIDTGNLWEAGAKVLWADWRDVQKLPPVRINNPLDPDGPTSLNASLKLDIVRSAVPTAGPKALPVLMEALRDEDLAVRREAIRALGSLGPEAREADAALRKLQQDPELRDAATAALKQIGKR